MAVAQHESMAEMIRQAVDFFAKAKQEGGEARRRRRAIATAGRFRSGVMDLAEWIDKTVHHAAMGVMLAAERKNLSLVDCVSFESMRLGGITTAFTLDKHFKEQGFICLPV
jgi:predicted nucleic acid-binding protein